jgi:hypothetical protein
VRPATFDDSWETICTVNNGNGLYIRSTGVINVLTAGGTHPANNALPLNAWTHIAFVNNAGSWIIYTNGVSDGSGTGATTIGVISRMGDDGASETFEGRLAEVAVFSIALSGVQVAALTAKSTTPGTIGSLYAWWKLDEIANGVSGDGASFTDSSGNGNTGTGSDGANDTGFTGVTADY